MLKSTYSKAALAMVAAVGIAVLAQTAMGEPEVPEVKKIAELVKKGDMPGAKKAAAAYAKAHEELEENMYLFGPAKKGKGIGVAGADPSKGIESELTKIGRDAPSPAQMTKMAKAYEELGYDAVAVMLITEAFAPTADSGKKTRKVWSDSISGVTEASMKFAAAAKNNSSADVKMYANKILNNCKTCHDVFKN